MVFDPKRGTNLEQMLVNTKLKEIMSSPVVTIHEDEEFSKVEELFTQHGIYYLPVVDSEKKVVGLISQKYLYKMHSPRKIVSEQMEYRPDIIIDGDAFYDKETLDSYILRNIMLKDPLVLKGDESVKLAISHMVKRHLGCIPIVDGEQSIIGMVINEDIIRLIGRLLRI